MNTDIVSSPDHTFMMTSAQFCRFLQILPRELMFYSRHNYFSLTEYALFIAVLD